jgi:hypothetical protein
VIPFFCFHLGFGFWVPEARDFGFLDLPCLDGTEPCPSLHDLARLHDQRNEHHERNERIDRMTRVRNVELELPRSRVLRSYSKGDTDMVLIVFQVLKPILHSLLIAESIDFLSLAFNRRLQPAAYKRIAVRLTRVSILPCYFVARWVCDRSWSWSNVFEHLRKRQTKD